MVPLVRVIAEAATVAAMRGAIKAGVAKPGAAMTGARMSNEAAADATVGNPR